MNSRAALFSFCAATLLHFYLVAQASATDLHQLAGRWSGQARMSFNSGATESAKCISTYFVEGASVKQNIRCATTDFKVFLKSHLHVSGSEVSGNWSVENPSMSGAVQGTSTGGTLKLNVNGSVNGRMLIKTNGCSQSVNIHFEDQAYPKIAISMKKC